MFDNTITVGSATFVLRLNQRKARLNYSTALEKLSAQYAGYKALADELENVRGAAAAAGMDQEAISTMIGLRMQANPAMATALAWRDAASDFSANIYPYVVSAAGLPFEWPAASSTPEAFGKALDYLLDTPEVYDALEEAIKVMALPNGTTGAPAALLTQEQSASPLSPVPEPTGSSDFANG